MREVGGDACVYFDNDLAGCIKRVCGDGDLRKLLSERGLVRCREFSWKESANTYLGLYEKVLQKRDDG